MILLTLKPSVTLAAAAHIAQFLPLILIVVLFYFLLIRPQQKRSKEHRQMLAALSVNDEVMTNGGIFGKVVKIGDNVVVLDLGHGEVRFQKQSVQTLLPQGTLDKL